MAFSVGIFSDSGSGCVSPPACRNLSFHRKTWCRESEQIADEFLFTANALSKIKQLPLSIICVLAAVRHTCSLYMREVLFKHLAEGEIGCASDSCHRDIQTLFSLCFL